MTCFSIGAPSGWVGKLLGPKVRVSATNIFARMVAPGVQALGFAMDLSTKVDVAFVVPVPVRAGGGDRAVRFVDVQHRPMMFEELADLFVREAPRRTGPIHKMGAALATYVETIDDFGQLDSRFHVPPALLAALPEYRDHGFVVFQIAAGSGTLQPIGFRFATREVDRLYFPTVHMHDGRWHPNAAFDHTLYYQHPMVRTVGGAFEADRAGVVLPSHSYGRLLDVNAPVLRRAVRGVQPNEDMWIATGRPTGIHST